MYKHNVITEYPKIARDFSHGYEYTLLPALAKFIMRNVDTILTYWCNCKIPPHYCFTSQPPPSALYKLIME